ncbi:MAG: hypothetical protein AB1512_16625 [Thermodesulfobacteriota bacterium]
MIALDQSQRLQVLLAQLQERYNAAHKIRERSTQFTLWISGMAIGLGWLLISQRALVLAQRIALSLLIAALFAGTVYFMMGLRRGFQKNRKTMIRIERALGLHEAGIYLENGPLLASEYGLTNRKWSDHFHTLYIWLVLVAVSLLILTWTCPDPAKSSPVVVKTEQIKGGNHNGGSKH